MWIFLWRLSGKINKETLVVWTVYVHFKGKEKKLKSFPTTCHNDVTRRTIKFQRPFLLEYPSTQEYPAHSWPKLNINGSSTVQLLNYSTGNLTPFFLRFINLSQKLSLLGSTYSYSILLRPTVLTTFRHTYNLLVSILIYNTYDLVSFKLIQSYTHTYETKFKYIIKYKSKVRKTGDMAHKSIYKISPIELK